MTFEFAMLVNLFIVFMILVWGLVFSDFRGMRRVFLDCRLCLEDLAVRMRALCFL